MLPSFHGAGPAIPGAISGDRRCHRGHTNRPLGYLCPGLVAGGQTGRLLARGNIYDRQTTPVMYWTGLISMFAITLFMTFAAIVLAAYGVARFWN
jgi:hypothetical protein